MTDDIFDTDAGVADEFRRYMADPAARQAFVEAKARAADGGAVRSYRNILRAIGETPWAIRPAMLGVIVDLIAFRVAGGRFTAEEIDERIMAARRTTTAAPAGVAVIPIHGTIIPRASAFGDVSGGTSVMGIRTAFREAMAAGDIASIVLDIDSPGGMVDGVPELAGEMRSARGRKRITAVANTEANSAAYWLATQADEVVVSKSATVGSIGVFTAHEDQSVADEMAGIKTTLISAGKFKTEANPFEPLSDDARSHMQSLVDNYYGMFVSDVARGRGTGIAAVRDGFGQGRVVSATEAIRTGMADRVATLDDVIAEHLAAVRGGPAATTTGRVMAPTSSDTVSAPIAVHGVIPWTDELAADGTHPEVVPVATAEDAPHVPNVPDEDPDLARLMDAIGDDASARIDPPDPDPTPTPDDLPPGEDAPVEPEPDAEPVGVGNKAARATEIDRIRGELAYLRGMSE